MIDKITIRLQNIKEDIRKEDSWKLLKNTGEKLVYIRKLKNSKSILGGGWGLLLTFVTDITNQTICSLSIKGSLRKWYFGKNCKRDLSLSEFSHCIDLLSEAIGVNKEILLQGRVTKIETGATLVLPARYRVVQDRLYSYPKLQRNKVYDSTLYFGDKRKSSYHLILYDKYEEIYKNRKDKSRMLKANLKIYFMRFEISVNTPSRISFFKEEVNTVQKISDNWDKIGEHLLNTFEKIKYADFSGEPELGNKSYNEFKKLAIFYGIKTIGMNYFVDQINSSDMSNKVNLISNFSGIAEHFSRNNENYKHNIYLKLKEKISRLSKSL